MGSVTLVTCILATISTPIAGYWLKNKADRSRSKGAMTCAISSGCLTVLCLLASFGVQIWVKRRIAITFLNAFTIVKGSTLVYPEYASVDINKDDWSECQQVPVTFAFILITMTWVRKRNFEFYILNMRKALYSIFRLVLAL